jgi:3-deoxy-7-phosphoheptulonate synthase
MGVTEQGLAAIVKTRGNKDVHVILRGGTKGPNYSSQDVKEAAAVIEKKRGHASIMIDCSRTSYLSATLANIPNHHPFLSMV